MGKLYKTIDSELRDWMSRQQMFFVASAPLGKDGHVNVSPKGHDTLRVLDGNTLAYLDYGGSGIETVAHLRENGRIVIMMCSFEGAPKIYRFHGTGSVITPRDAEFPDLAVHFDRSELGIRAIIRVDVERISDSCGFGVPLYEYQGQRRTSPDGQRKSGKEKMRAYFKRNNPQSIDALPGLSEAEADAFEPAVNDNSRNQQG
jgi:hypothetical protein